MWFYDKKVRLNNLHREIKWRKVVRSELATSWLQLWNHSITPLQDIYGRSLVNYLLQKIMHHAVHWQKQREHHYAEDVNRNHSATTHWWRRLSTGRWWECCSWFTALRSWRGANWLVLWSHSSSNRGASTMNDRNKSHENVICLQSADITLHFH